MTPGKILVFGQEPHLSTYIACQLQIKSQRVTADGFILQILPSDTEYHSAAHESSTLETAMHKYCGVEQQNWAKN